MTSSTWKVHATPDAAKRAKCAAIGGLPVEGRLARLAVHGMLGKPGSRSGEVASRERVQDVGERTECAGHGGGSGFPARIAAIIAVTRSASGRLPSLR